MNASPAEIAELATSEGDLDGAVLARLSGGGASRALEYLDRVRSDFDWPAVSPRRRGRAAARGDPQRVNRTANALDKIMMPGRPCVAVVLRAGSRCR